MGFDFSTLTPEARAAAREKARTVRAAKIAARSANRESMKLSYKDEAHWDDLARKFGVGRMPSREDPVDATHIRKWLNKLDITFEEFNAHFTDVKYFVKNNPTWTKYAAVGVLLELKDQLELEAA